MGIPRVEKRRLKPCERKEQDPIVDASQRTSRTRTAPGSAPGTAMGLRPSCPRCRGTVQHRHRKEMEALRAPSPSHRPPVCEGATGRDRPAGDDTWERPSTSPHSTARGLQAEHPAMGSQRHMKRVLIDHVDPVTPNEVLMRYSLWGYRSSGVFQSRIARRTSTSPRKAFALQRRSRSPVRSPSSSPEMAVSISFRNPWTLLA